MTTAMIAGHAVMALAAACRGCGRELVAVVFGPDARVPPLCAACIPTEGG